VADLEPGEEGQQGVHPGAGREQWLVDVDVQKQGGLADVLHDGCIVLERHSGGKTGERQREINK